MTIAVNDSYATIDEADVYVETNSIWLASSDDEKEDALLWARYFIDARYSAEFDQASPPDEVKFASALLAIDYLTTGDLFSTNEQIVKKKTVKAGPIETTKEFVAVAKTKPSSLDKVDAIMRSVATILPTGSVFLIRG